MNRGLAAKAWRLFPVIWHAEDTAPEPPTVTVGGVHYHLHLAPGVTVEDAKAALTAALPQQRDAITSEGEQE